MVIWLRQGWIRSNGDAVGWTAGREGEANIDKEKKRKGNIGVFTKESTEGGPRTRDERHAHHPKRRDKNNYFPRGHSSLLYIRYKSMDDPWHHPTSAQLSPWATWYARYGTWGTAHPVAAAGQNWKHDPHLFTQHSAAVEIAVSGAHLGPLVTSRVWCGVVPAVKVEAYETRKFVPMQPRKGVCIVYCPLYLHSR